MAHICRYTLIVLVVYQSHCVIQGIRSYYSSEARQLNAVIKATQKENQMEMFINANKSCPSTR